jgi:hypothetical protein
MLVVFDSATGRASAWAGGTHPRGYTGGGKMSKQKPREVFAKVVCERARSVIVAALCLAGFLAALQLAALLPEPWSAVGITTLLLVTGLPLLGKWPGHGFRLESLGLGHQPDGQPNPQPVAPVSPRGVPARSRPALDVVLDSR